MNYRIHKTKIKTIRSDSPDFFLKDSIVRTHRAGFEISPTCPTPYRELISQAIDNGWLKPVAYMYDYEYTMDSLKNE